MSTSLEPTDRTTVTRGRNRSVSDRDRLHALLASAPVAHVGVISGSHPVVIPVAFAIDLDGPDDDGTLYLHGSVAAGWMRRAVGTPICVTVTELDALVLARSGFNHSVNYRSAVVIGTARAVEGDAEKVHALGLTVDHLVPGRAATLRASSRKELAATAVLAVSLREASMKQREGDPVDDEVDLPTQPGSGVWAGTLPLVRTTTGPVSGGDSHHDVPPDVAALARSLGSGA